MTITQDPRYRILRERLTNLTSAQLKRILEYPHEMVLDEYNYDEQGQHFCPLAVAFDLPAKLHVKDVTLTNALVRGEVQRVGEAAMPGFKISPTKGVPGTFYTTNREEDLLGLVRLVLKEKESLWQSR